ncbi:MAG: site-2 protease family protein [Candidatus Eisenbacteria bacterium]|nr:site-2 protease family protein [Candidatus Eisenbacteria bacterium]
MIEALPKLFVLLFSIVLHEIAHGWMALKNGDPTARDAGRLTFNLIPHIDIFGTILLPLFLMIVQSPVLFGWAKPVPIDPRNFRNPRVGIGLVGAAGPGANIILAVLAAITFRVAVALGWITGPGFVATMLVYGVAINIILAVFNMVPIPPLDGSRVIIPFAPVGLRRVLAQLEPYGMFIIFGLLYVGFFRFVISPIYLFFTRLFLGF